jgi:hypothetical protein
MDQEAFKGLAMIFSIPLLIWWLYRVEIKPQEDKKREEFFKKLDEAAEIIGKKSKKEDKE